MRPLEFYRGREQTYVKHFFLEKYLERVAYNILSGQVQRYSHQLEAFAGEFITILSRQLEEQV